MSRPTKKHAVGDQFWPHDLHDPQSPFVDLGLGLYGRQREYYYECRHRT